MKQVQDELKQLNIVVLDADREQGSQVKQLLSTSGFQRVQILGKLADFSNQQFVPDMVLVHGDEELPALREELPPGDSVPVLVLTDSALVEDRERAFDSGASDVLSSPVIASELIARVQNFLRTRQLYKELEHHSLEMELRVQERTMELSQAAEDCLMRLAKASEYRDDDTGEHTMRVGTLSAEIARSLGEAQDQVELIRQAAPLHDIGKIGIPDSILLKPGRLTEGEFDLIKSHVKIGASLLAGSSSKLIQMAELIARTHHERWDGTGYTQGLKGEEIPLPGRIVAVADVFDALTNNRPYKDAWPVKDAIEEISGLSGSHFDPAVVEAFQEVMRSSVTKAS